MRHVLTFLLLALFVSTASAKIEKIQLIGSDEIELDADAILTLPGIGLSMRTKGDSIMLLDDPRLTTFGFNEPNNARSLAAVRSGVYAADGDSIFRIASPEATHKFIGRMDNEAFRLYPASDSTFFACTADEEFSCVYEIFPETRTCEPVISIKGPILRIEGNGATTMMWVDDAILRLHPEGIIENIYQADNITGMALTPIGVMVGTTEGIYWLTGRDTGAKIVKEPVKGVWWDNSDALYYLTSAGDLIMVTGMQQSFNENENAHK